MKYSLQIANHHRRHLLVQMSLPACAHEIILRLPRWRPGRYEMMDYANNLFELRTKSSDGNDTEVERIGTHEWRVPAHQQQLLLEYKYYAAVLDAGRSYVDDSQLYVNPCNLFLYEEQSINAPCSLELDLPADWELAVGLRREGNTLFADSFHTLADSPFFASPSLQKISYSIEGVPFICWFQGEVSLPQERIMAEFSAFSLTQYQLFGGFPFSEYHFLFQFVDEKFHHGVEHQNNTVIVLGPGRKFHQASNHMDFLGISSHELFHAWNVKAIRPAEMQPYDYGQAQYSKLHYVTEGVTTYYGDLMLLKSGVWSLEEWLETFNEGDMGRYFSNQGGNYISLEQSSFESWTVGYSPGVPNRKISFYSKGAIVAFMLDVCIRISTHNQRSLDTVMRLLYERFGKTGIGYTRSDYLGLVNEVSGENFSHFFDLYISGTYPVTQQLSQCAQYVGLALVETGAGTPSFHSLGLVLDDDAPGWPIKLVLEDSPADRAGLAVGDQIMAVNGLRAGSRLDDLLTNMLPERNSSWHELPDLDLIVLRQGRVLSFLLVGNPDFTPGRWRLEHDPMATPAQLENRRVWMSLLP